jgi:hypothetical protein
VAARREAALLEEEKQAAADMQAEARWRLSRLKWIQKEKLAEEERKLAQGGAELGSLVAARMAAEEEISQVIFLW